VAVDWLVVPGVDLESSAAALELAAAHPGRVLATAGLHPHDASLWPQQGDQIAELAPKAAAIGETGLDFYRDLSPRDAQESALRFQVELAIQLDLPLVVHCRDAFERLHALLEETDAGSRTLLHCWTGGPRWTARFLELGCMFSFAGPLAFETGDTVRRGAAMVPPERAMVETDTPFLSPPPFRGEPNEPARVVLVGEALARIWQVDALEVARITSANAAAVFRR
jgi:TatD DNase family protein